MARLVDSSPLRRLSRRVWMVSLATMLSVALAAVLFACTQTPTPVPVRTFERAQKVDFVCLQLFQDAGNGLRQTIRPVGRPLADCTQSPAGEDGATYKNQLFALVTQSARGEVAVVNLTTGFIMDVSARVPSAGFLPVGTVPTDIAASPDGEVTFVASADPAKPAIYALPSSRIVGDKAAVRDDVTGAVIPLPADDKGVPTLTSWPSCVLPQAPGALTVVPRKPVATGDPSYELVAILPGDRTTPAKVVTLDPRPFLRGAGLAADAGASAPVIAPGSLAPCTLAITSATELVGEERVPAAFAKGATWQTGVPYVGDGGAVDLACAVPSRPGACGAPPCCAPKERAPAEAFTTPGIDASAEVETTDGGAPSGCAAPSGDAGARALDLGPLDPPRAVAVARDDTTLYVADEALPFVHVLDLSVPGAITERAPLLATSETDPSRLVGVKALAVSPPTREYKKFLYAVEARSGTLLVYDVSQPSDAPRTPLTRPYPELNPFQPPDRVAFSSPVVAVEFARTDIPIRVDDNDPAGLAGVLCNPNPSLGVNDPGALYRSGSSKRGAIDARSLRGIFAFVTLANGTVAVVDIEDWDAPCRRPAVLAPELVQSGVTRPFSTTAPAQPSIAGDPWGAPFSAENSTTDEAFFPVSVPHHLRSATLLRASTTSGKQIPYLSGPPVVDRLGAILPIAGEGSDATPILRPTVEQPAEPATGPAVRFSFEVPEVHVDQDWTVTYEGQLPGFDGFEGTLATDDGYQSLELRQPGARFCSKGVEDWETGKARAAEIRSALRRSARRTSEPTETTERRMADYVQLTSELLGPDDPYWNVGEGTEAGSCWQGVQVAKGRARYDLCNATFGTVADESSPVRDFPVLEAYDDRLVLGRFFTFTPGASREVVYKDPSNAGALKLAQCCFHGQAKFKVRGGGQWVAVGSAYGFLSHQVAGADGRCGPSCEPREALLNGRAPAVPRGLANLSVPAVSRDSVLALRNPVFSFFVENGTRRVTENGVTREVDVPPARNTQWRFSTKGQFQALSVAIGGQSTSVSPQSMRFVGPLAQMAVVDAATQGLVLIDLRTVAIAHTPYF